MSFSNIVLLVILALGIISRNNMLSISACSILLFSLLGLNEVLIKLEELGINAGIVILTMGVLAPIALNKISKENISSLFTQPSGVIAIFAGLIVTVFAGRGVIVLKSDPEMVLGILIGTIAGIGFFKGTPVGPLIGAGIAALLLSLFKLVFK